MRIITEHKVNPANDQISLEVIDEPGDGGACHHYEASFMDKDCNMHFTDIHFQNGPIGEDGLGINGLTQEVLMTICIDRLRSFQAGPFACRENALALTKLEEAQHWLHSRTRSRMDRGVEGAHKI